MSEGKYTATYKFILEGIGLTAPLNVAARPGKQVELFVGDENACEFKAAVVVENVSEAAGAAAARTIANDLYEQLIRRLAAHVERAVPPMLDTFSFQANTATSVARGLAVETSMVVAVGRASLAPALFVSCLDAALDVPMTTVHPAVEAALRMYRVAVETPEAVASFLICYSALALGAEHKRGKGKQQDVDQLLRAEDPSMPQTIIDPYGVPRNETIYTEIRNRFIHAEDRGKDPNRAAKDMKAHVRKFRDLAARALLVL